MKIERTRYVVMRKDRTEIQVLKVSKKLSENFVLLGPAKNFYFKKLDEVGDTTIKTYASEKKALSSCNSWDRNHEAKSSFRTLKEPLVLFVPVKETIEFL